MRYNALRVRRGLWLRVTMILTAMGEHRGRRDNREQNASQHKIPNKSRDLTSHIPKYKGNSCTTRFFRCLLGLTGVFDEAMRPRCVIRDRRCLLSNTIGGGRDFCGHYLSVLETVCMRVMGRFNCELHARIRETSDNFSCGLKSITE